MNIGDSKKRSIIKAQMLFPKAFKAFEYNICAFLSLHFLESSVKPD
jgi:hypothetical protein